MKFPPITRFLLVLLFTLSSDIHNSLHLFSLDARFCGEIKHSRVAFVHSFQFRVITTHFHSSLRRTTRATQNTLYYDQFKVTSISSKSRNEKNHNYYRKDIAYSGRASGVDETSQWNHFLTYILDNYSQIKTHKISRQVLFHFQKMENEPFLQEMIQDIISLQIDCRPNGTKDDGKVYFASLLTPRDQTNIIRLLGSRQLYETMHCFLNFLTSSRNNILPQNHRHFQYAYAAAISALAQSSDQKYRRKAISLLDEMDKLGIEPNSYVITAVFLSIDGGIAVREMLKRVRSYKTIQIDIHIYNAAIYAFSRTPTNNNQSSMNDWQSALAIFRREMPKDGVKPNQQTYASLLQAFAKSGQIKVALSLFDEMRNTPSVGKPSVKVWSALLRACSLAGDWKRTIKLVLAMNEEKVDINVLHLNYVLAALAKSGNDILAFDLLNAMQNKAALSFLYRTCADNVSREFSSEDRILPDLVSINTVLTAFAEKHNKSKAMSLFHEVQEGKYTARKDYKCVVIKPDIVSYNTILSMFEDPRDVVSLLYEIRMTRRNRNNPLKPTCQTYTNAISICSRCNPPDLSMALELLKDAETKDGLIPNVFMYSATIWTAERSGNATIALNVLNLMKPKCKPNTICYDGVMSALGKQGMIEEAMKVFYEMKNDNIPLSRNTFQGLATAASRSSVEMEVLLNNLRKLLTMLSEDEKRVELCGSIYNFLILGYGSIGKVEDALYIFDSIRQTNSQCLSAILYVCSTSHPARWEDAITIIHSSDIVVGAQGPGKIEAMALTYAIIACSKENEGDEALNLLELYGMANNSETPRVKVDAINSVIAAAGRSGRPDIAVKTLNEMSTKFGLSPNERTYRSAIVSCNQAEHEKKRQRDRSAMSSNLNYEEPLSFEYWEVALSLLRRMREDDIHPSTQTYTSVISSCEAAGQWQRALGILRSMTQNQMHKPNLFCFNAALAACEKGNAWLEAVELYERMKAEGGAVRPNFISLNSLLISLEKGEQRELAESIYKEALLRKIVKPWKMTLDSVGSEHIKAMDLHQFSRPMAKIAVRNVIDSLLLKVPTHDATNDLIIIIGKGHGSEDRKAKLMPVVRDMLTDEYDIESNIEKSNVGRIRVKSEVLMQFVQRRSWK